MSTDVILMLTLAALGGVLAPLLRLPPLVGFLVAGFVLAGLGVEGGSTLEAMADLGVVLLLFAVGLKFDPRNLARREVMGVASVHVVTSASIVTLVLGGLALAGVSLVADATPAALALVAMALSFSSTVVAIKVLEEQNATRSLHGRTTVGIVVIQDLFAVAVLVLVGGEAPEWWALALVLLVPAAWPVRRLLQRLDHGELLPLVAVVLALLPGYALFEVVGLKGDLGALVVGMLLGSSSRAEEMSKSIFSVKELLLVAFFLSVGLNATPDLGDLGLALVLLTLVPLKGLLFAVLLRASGLRARSATFTATSLASYSEFSLIVVVAGTSAGVLDQGWLVAVSTAVALSFVLSVVMGQQIEPLARLATRWLADPSDDRLHLGERSVDLTHADAIVLGMGRLGRAAFLRLTDGYGMRVKGIDSDAARVEHLTQAGLDVVDGDATDAMFWERVTAAGTVRLVVLAMPFHGSNLSALEQLERSQFDGTVTAITRYDDETAQFTERAGVVPMYEAAGAELADRAALAADVTDPGAGPGDGIS